MSKKEKLIAKEGMICPHCGIHLLKKLRKHLRCSYCKSMYIEDKEV